MKSPPSIKPYQFSVPKLLRRFDPYKSPPWDAVKVLTKQMVARAIADERYEEACWTHPPEDEYIDRACSSSVVWTPERHAARIAYFVVHGWEEPIDLDVGCPSLGYEGPDNIILDGNHRFAAAVYAKDPVILAYYGGEVDEAKKYMA